MLQLKRLKSQRVTSTLIKLDYVDNSKEVLEKILKDNDCEGLNDNNKAVECVEPEKDTELVFWKE